MSPNYKINLNSTGEHNLEKMYKGLTCEVFFQSMVLMAVAGLMP